MSEITLRWDYNFPDIPSGTSTRSYVYAGNKDKKDYFQPKLTTTAPTKRLIVIQNETRRTLSNLFVAFNLTFFGIILSMATSYGILVVLVATAILFRHLSHLTTLLIFAKRESNGTRQ